MSDPLIGQYVRRQHGRLVKWRVVEWLTLPHLVESVIDDEPVTRCGRRLRAIEGTAFVYRPVFPARTCVWCT